MQADEMKLQECYKLFKPQNSLIVGQVVILSICNENTGICGQALELYNMIFNLLILCIHTGFFSHVQAKDSEGSIQEASGLQHIQNYHHGWL